MTELTTNDFAAFFAALWSRPPFAWQQRLAERALTNPRSPWPEAIALPTAAGKTACIDIAVFALAAQAGRLGRGELIDAPRRIFFVVDRRVIVDEAYDRAEHLARRLAAARDGILRSVADALRLMARGEAEGWQEEPPLTVHTLRGASYRSESWARSPLQPAIIASTVDQLGSRLLFRAYGRGPGMWPVYAGLAANDSLILLDEAHCAQPFMQTLQAVRRFRRWGKASFERSFHPVVLSATPPAGLDDVFFDDSEEPGDPGHPLGRRQLAHKPTVLLKADKATGKNATDHLAKALAETAETLAEGQGRAVVIFVNRVATARAVRDLLRKRHPNQTTLLTGRMRGIDKQAMIAQHLEPLSSANAENRRLDRPQFIVATQTLEVGADLDFDLLVTECAALDALRQRFGRLNRMGRPIQSRAAILIRADQAEKSDDDPVYGSALSNTWTWLNEQLDDLGELDFGIAHLAPRLPTGEALDRLNSPSLDAPVMLPAHIDAWAQTNPAPLPSPDIALFLHGPRETRADIHVCWRVSPHDEALQLCPPSAAETLPVPLGLFRRWLAGEPIEDASSDIEGGNETDNLPEAASATARQVLRWRNGEAEPLTDSRALRPGDLLILPLAETGSLQLGDLPSTADTEPSRLDVSQQAYLTARAKALLRLEPALIATWPSAEARAQANELLDLGAGEEPDTQLALLRDLLQTLEAATRDESEWFWLHEIAVQLGREARRRSFLRGLYRVGDRDLIVLGQNLIRSYTRQAETFSDEDDRSASGIGNHRGGPVRLSTHLPGVEAWARRFAIGCGLPEALIDALALAGLLHDLGKADPRFQALLRGGGPLPMLGGEPLAKSGAMPRTRAAFEAAREAAGYPAGGRHELLSLRLAESAPELLPNDPLLRHLVLHLVTSHHGYCRPFAPVVEDDQAPEVSLSLNGHSLTWKGPTRLEALEAGVCRRYWELTQAYGWWGLAWLEALLRLGDHRRSEWEQTHDPEAAHD